MHRSGKAVWRETLNQKFNKEIHRHTERHVMETAIFQFHFPVLVASFPSLRHVEGNDDLGFSSTATQVTSPTV